MFEFSSGLGAPESTQFAFTFHSGPPGGPQDSQPSVPTSDLPEIIPTSASTSTPIFAIRNTIPAQDVPLSAADKLPTELLEIFFEYLDFGTISKEYLLVCSCVSRRWRAIALPHLFRTIFIHFHGLPTQEPAPKESPAFPSRAGPRGYTLRSKKEEGTNKTARRASTLVAITRFFSVNPQFAAHVRNLHLALALPARKIWRKLEADGNTTVDRPSSDEVDREYRNNLPVTDASTLLAALRVFPRLDSLVLYDATLRGPFDLGPHDPIDVPRLRLSFTGRKGEEAPLAEYVNVLGLFRAVDELRIDSFGDKAILDKPDALAHTDRFTLSPHIVDIDPLSSAAYAAVAKIIARSPALRHVEIGRVRDPRQQRAAFRPRPRVSAADEQRLTVVLHILSVRNSVAVSQDSSWYAVAGLLWPLIARPGAGPTTLVVARNRLPSIHGVTQREMGRDDVARVLAHLDAVSGPLTSPLLLCHLQWDDCVSPPECHLCCAELDATRARISTSELGDMIVQSMQPDNCPEERRDALDVVRGLGMKHALYKLGQSPCVCTRTVAKS